MLLPKWLCIRINDVAFRCRNGSEMKMVHVSTTALCLVLLSRLSVGFPTTSTLQDTSGPTKVELLAAGQGENASAKGDATTTAKVTNADSASNSAASYSSPKPATVKILTEGKRISLL